MNSNVIKIAPSYMKDHPLIKKLLMSNAYSKHTLTDKQIDKVMT